jgi:hypothetical protein
MAQKSTSYTPKDNVNLSYLNTSRRESCEGKEAASAHFNLHSRWTLNLAAF